MCKIVLADDHIPTLKRVSDFVKQQGNYRILATCANGHELIIKLNALKEMPELILIDINMPVIDGIAASFYCRFKFPSVKIIIVTIYDDEDAVKQSIYAGANGFVMKALAEKVLKDAIETVLKGDFFIDKYADIATGTKQNLLKRYKKLIENENENALTKREREFIILNATPLTYEQIAQIMFVETKTVNSYFEKIAKKLEVKNRQALTVKAIQMGLAKLANYPAED